MQKAVLNFITKDYYTLSTFEDKYSCSSYCKTPLFSLNSQISAATMPNQDCITRNLHSAKQISAITLLINAGLLFLSFLCAIPLYYRPKKKKTYDY